MGAEKLPPFSSSKTPLNNFAGHAKLPRSSRDEVYYPYFRNSSTALLAFYSASKTDNRKHPTHMSSPATWWLLSMARRPIRASSDCFTTTPTSLGADSMMPTPLTLFHCKSGNLEKDFDCSPANNTGIYYLVSVVQQHCMQEDNVRSSYLYITTRARCVKTGHSSSGDSTGSACMISMHDQHWISMHGIISRSPHKGVPTFFLLIYLPVSLEGLLNPNKLNPTGCTAQVVLYCSHDGRVTVTLTPWMCAPYRCY